jgi:predicted DNA-binding transcriptional regulator YafY
MVDTAAVRALRSMDLIPYVLENPGVSIAELSARFSVTQAQIESDLQLVFMCGLPGYTPYELIDVAFEDGVVSIIDPQVLDKPRKFSSNEIVVIALGLKILIDINQTNSTALTKLKQLSDKIAKLGSNKSILMTGDVSAFPFFEIISKAISEQRVLDVQYHSLTKDEITQRKVLPEKLYFLNGSLYLSAIDTDIDSDRVFKVDLIKECKIGERVAGKKLFESSLETTVVLDVQKQNRMFIERNSSIITAMQENGDLIRVHLQVSSLEWLKLTVLSNAAGITVVSPESLADAVEQSARDLLALY